MCVGVGGGSSWYAWVCPLGQHPLGSSTAFVSGASGQECASNVHRNEGRLVTFPHVKHDRTQPDALNWHFDWTHFHMPYPELPDPVHFTTVLKICPTCKILYNINFQRFDEHVASYQPWHCQIYFCLKVNQTEKQWGSAVISVNDRSLMVSLNHLYDDTAQTRQSWLSWSDIQGNAS